MAILANSTANAKILITNVANNYAWVLAYMTSLLARGTVKMSTLKCFNTSSDPPDPRVPLSKELDSCTIGLVKEKVKPEIEKSQRHCKRF